MSADAALSPDLLIDGRYRLVARVPDWGVGECWRARDVEAHKRVVVKVLPAFAPSDARRSSEFQSLARRLVKLQHRGVAATLASGFTQGRPYLVQEYLDGVSLGLGLSRARSAAKLLEPGMLANLLDRAFEAVAAAHAEPRPLVHGGLTAGSIVAAMVDGRLLVRVLDFGLVPLFGARLRDRASSEYVAPELDDDPDRIAPGCDVFALGAILAEAITDRRTASGGLAATVGGLSAVARPRDDVPNALMGVASRAMRHDPDQRFATAGALHEALLAAWSRPAVQATDDAPPPGDNASSVSWEHYRADAPTAPSGTPPVDLFTASTNAAPVFAPMVAPVVAPMVLPPLSAPPGDPSRTVAASASVAAPSGATFDATLVAKPPVATAGFDATIVARPAWETAPHAEAGSAALNTSSTPAGAPARRAPLVALVVVALLGVALRWLLGPR